MKALTIVLKIYVDVQINRAKKTSEGLNAVECKKDVRAQSLTVPLLFKGQRLGSKCFLIKVQSSVLRVGAIKRKD